MIQTQAIRPPIRSRPAVSSAVDSHRAHATALRRQAMRDAWKLRRAGVGLLATVCVLAVLLLLA